VLGDVGRRTAVLAAEREALQQAQPDQDDRRAAMPMRVAGSTPTTKSTRHQQDRDEEGVLAADRSPSAEHQRAEGRTAKPAANASSAKMKPTSA
jgi:hypothetical protein